MLAGPMHRRKSVKWVFQSFGSIYGCTKLTQIPDLPDQSRWLPELFLARPIIARQVLRDLRILASQVCCHQRQRGQRHFSSKDICDRA